MKLYIIYIVTCSYYCILAGDNRTDIKSNCDTKYKITPETEYNNDGTPPRCFGIDIDGTFYTSNANSFERNIKAFIKVMKLGYTPFFCTGRPFVASLLTEKFKKLTGYNGYPGIYCNGSVVYDKDGRLIKLTSFDSNVLEKFYKYLSEKNKTNITVFFTCDKIYSLCKLTDEINNLLNDKINLIPDIITHDEFIKLKVVGLTIFDVDNDIYNYIDKDDCLKHFQDGNNISYFIPPNTFKLDSFKLLVSRLGELPSKCGYIGNGSNDIDILKLCDISFAVGDSPNIVKMNAKYTLDKTHSDAAFADAMKIVYGISI